MRVQCPKCQKKLRSQEDLVGKKVRCPACKHVFLMPSPLAEAEIEALATQIMTADGISVTDLAEMKEKTAKLAQCGTPAAPIIRRVLVGTRMTRGVHFSNAATLCRVLGEIGGPVALETLNLLVRADSQVGEFQTVKKAAREALASLSVAADDGGGASPAPLSGHYYQGRVPQKGESVICFACGKTFDGRGPVFVDILGRERWFCPEQECIEKIKKTFAGKCAWCEKQLGEFGPEITGTTMGDKFCSKSCQQSCGEAIGDAMGRMGLW